MPRRLVVVVPAALALSLFFLGCSPTDRPAPSGASPDAATPSDPAPAPIRDISGTWEPANRPGDGTQAGGVHNMPNDGAPEHALPYTEYGLATYKSHKALEGVDRVPSAEGNDPRNLCEPLGFPRATHYNFRKTQVLQNEHKVVVLYQFAQTWRLIWIDGRENPKEIPERRWYGYSAGKWVDDYTLVVETVGLMPEDRVWLDATGRPISDQLRVEERFHRVNRDRLELTVTIDDPKMYTRPWLSMDKFPMALRDPRTDIQEMYCSPVELAKYNELYGEAVSDSDNTDSK